MMKGHVKDGRPGKLGKLEAVMDVGVRWDGSSRGRRRLATLVSRVLMNGVTPRM